MDVHLTYGPYIWQPWAKLRLRFRFEFDDLEFPDMLLQYFSQNNRNLTRSIPPEKLVSKCVCSSLHTDWNICLQTGTYTLDAYPHTSSSWNLVKWILTANLLRNQSCEGCSPCVLPDALFSYWEGMSPILQVKINCQIHSKPVLFSEPPNSFEIQHIWFPELCWYDLLHFWKTVVNNLVVRFSSVSL